jgi:acylphosphatase
MKQTRMRVLIEGRLQAMNFRFQTQKEAKQLELTGFVRTLSDGRFEIEAQGDQANLDKLLEWCQKEPHGSQIKSILYRFEENVNERYSDFSVR